MLFDFIIFAIAGVFYGYVLSKVNLKTALIRIGIITVVFYIFSFMSLSTTGKPLSIYDILIWFPVMGIALLWRAKFRRTKS